MGVYFGVCCGVFCLCAVFCNAFGLASPELQSFLGTSQTQQGLIVTFQSIGGLASAAFLALYGERFNKIRTIALGAVAVGLGTLLVGLLPLVLPGGGAAYVLLFVCMAVAGIGNSTIDLTMNGMVADLYPRKKHLYIPVIHTFYGAGAMLVPLLFPLAGRFSGELPGFSLAYLCIGGLWALSILAYLLSSRRVIPQSPYARMEQFRERASAHPAEVFTHGKSWLLILVAFLYCAYQTGLAAWLPSYQQEQLAMSETRSSLLVSLYFALSLVMRLLSPRILKRRPVENYYAFCGVCSALCMAGAFLAGGRGIYVPLLLLGGFFQGGMVPSFVIAASNAFPRRQSSTASFFLLALNLAGLVVPLLMGSIIQAAGFVAALLLISVCLLASGLLLKLVQRGNHTT